MALPQNVLMPLTWVLDVAKYLKAQPLDDDDAYDLYLEAEAKFKALLAREEYAERIKAEKGSS